MAIMLDDAEGMVALSKSAAKNSSADSDPQPETARRGAQSRYTGLVPVADVDI